jgi:hypothetical protein
MYTEVRMRWHKCVNQEGLYNTSGVPAFSVTFSLMMVAYMLPKHVKVKVILYRLCVTYQIYVLLLVLST